MQFGKSGIAEYVERCFDGFDIVPLGAIDMARLTPDLFEDEMAAQNALRNGEDYLKTFARGRYRRKGKAGRPSMFLRIADYDEAMCERLLSKALGYAVSVKNRLIPAGAYKIYIYYI